MQLSNKAILDFKRIYLAKFGEAISDVEANEKGLILLEFFKLIYRPLPINKYQLLQSRKVLDHYGCPDDIKKTGEINGDRPKQPTPTQTNY